MLFPKSHVVKPGLPSEAFLIYEALAKLMAKEGLSNTGMELGKLRSMPLLVMRQGDDYRIDSLRWRGFKGTSLLTKHKLL